MGAWKGEELEDKRDSEKGRGLRDTRVQGEEEFGPQIITTTVIIAKTGFCELGR